MYAGIKAIDYYLPKRILSNEDLANEFPGLSPEVIKEKTGIIKRHIADDDECSSDLAIEASRKIIEKLAQKGKEIDYIILCTQTPDYFLPSTSCIIQNKLGLNQECGAVDINQGCSGFIYGLGMAKALIETAQANSVLLLTAETYSKLINPKDRSVRTVFGDAGAATLVSNVDYDAPLIGPFIYGTDGSGYNHLIVPAGGMRIRSCDKTKIIKLYESRNQRCDENLYMNGSEIFTFSLRVVPMVVESLLKKAKLSIGDIDLFIFHQASKMILENLRRKIGIPKDKYFVSYENYGNTVSSTIPIALKDAIDMGKVKNGMRVMLVGFGVGLSWAATLLRWTG